MIRSQHRTLNNAVFNTLPWAVSAILGLVFTPYIVHGFGAEAYGVLSVVLAIVGYLSFLDLNLGQAALKYVAQYNGEANVAKVDEVIGTTISLFLVIGITGGLALLLSADVILAQFLKINSALLPAARSAILFGALGFLVSLILSALTGTVNGLNRFDITGLVAVFSSIVISVGTVSLVKFGFSIEWAVALEVAISLVGSGVLMFSAKRVLPGLRCRPVLGGKMTINILRFGSYTVLSRVAYLITFRGNTILAGILLGSTYVTFYTVPVMLAQKLTAIIGRLANVTYPVFSELQGRKDLVHIRELYLDASRVILALSTAITIPLLVFGNKFIAVWMGQEFERNTGLVLPLSAAALYLMTITQVPSLMLNGLGHVKITGIFSVAGAALNLALIYPLSSIMGVSGIAASLLASQIVMVPIFLTWVNRKIIGMPMVELLKHVYAKPVILAVFVGAAAAVLPLDGTGNIFLVIGAMALTGLLYFSFAIGFGVITSAERQAVVSYVQVLTRRE